MDNSRRVTDAAATMPPMRDPAPLPDPLAGRPFDRRTAQAAGLLPGRLRRRDIRRPFHGVQIVGSIGSLRQRCEAYAVRLKPGQAFSHPTALRLLGLPLPRAYEEEVDLHVCAVLPAPVPTTRGVVGHRLRNAPPVIDLEGLPVVRADEAWAQMGRPLAVDELIELSDAILWGEPGMLPALRTAADVPHRDGAARLRRALTETRIGARSPGETRLRLLLVRAGLPDPELNAAVDLPSGRIHPDLVWRSARVAVEYEGDGHRGREQFRYDVARYEALQASGWTVVRVTADDLRGPAAEALIRRLHSLVG